MKRDRIVVRAKSRQDCRILRVLCCVHAETRRGRFIFSSSILAASTIASGQGLDGWESGKHCAHYIGREGRENAFSPNVKKKII